MHEPVTTADGIAGWVTDQRGAPNGGTEISTPGPTPTAQWYDANHVSPRPWPQPFPAGAQVCCYGQDCRVLSYDAAGHCYALLATLTLPPPSPVHGIAYGFVQQPHLYPDTPARHVAMWHGEPPEEPAQQQAA